MPLPSLAVTGTAGLFTLEHHQSHEFSHVFRMSEGMRDRIIVGRSSVGTQKSCNASFKSPIQSPSSSLKAGTKEALQQDIEDLRQKDSALDKETQQLMAEGYSIEELEEHISLLHEYNDLKDAGQLLMGRLAVLRGVTTKDLYKEFDLDLED